MKRKKTYETASGTVLHRDGSHVQVEIGNTEKLNPDFKTSGESLKKEIIYNKLVRDKIPEIIRGNGAECVTRIAEKDEYEKLLYVKLHEEANELIETPCAEEIADVLEVIEAIAKLKGIGIDDIKAIKTKKRLENGSFNKRIVLESATPDK